MLIPPVYFPSDSRSCEQLPLMTPFLKRDSHIGTGWFTRADATAGGLGYYTVAATPSRSGKSVNCGCLPASVSIAAALFTCS